MFLLITAKILLGIKKNTYLKLCGVFLKLHNIKQTKKNREKREQFTLLVLKQIQVFTLILYAVGTEMRNKAISFVLLLTGSVSLEVGLT